MAKKKKKKSKFAPVALFLSALTYKAMNTHFAISQTVKPAVSREQAESFADVSYFASSIGLVAYRKLGSGSPMLLLHDIFCTASGNDWMEAAFLLARDHTVYVPDLPACGLSDGTTSDYTNSYYLLFLEEFISKVIEEQAEVITLGLSATIGLTLSQMNPELVKSLSILNPLVVSPLSMRNDTRLKYLKPLLDVNAFTLLLYRQAFSRSRIEGSIVDTYYFNAFKSPSEYIDQAVTTASNQGAGRPELYRSLLLGHMDFNVKHILQKPNTPLRIFFGEKEANVDSMKQEIAELNPELPICIIPHTKHMPQLEDAEATVKLLIS